MSVENVIILGSGPAGLTAGIYAARAGLKPILLEGIESGGQLMQTNHVANYPGFPETVSGSTIISAMRAQAGKAGVRFVLDAVESVDFSGNIKKLSTMMGEVYEAKTVIIATGAGVEKTNLPGEAKYFGRGISACLTCDGAFYSGKKVAIISEGAAAEGARKYLAGCGAEVVGIYAPSQVESFDGDDKRLTGITLKEVPAQDEVNELVLQSVSGNAGAKKVFCEGVFLVAGRRPQTKFLGDALELDEKGHVVAHGTRTSVDGVFAAGDCAEPKFKQAVVAAGDGARAAMEAREKVVGGW